MPDLPPECHRCNRRFNASDTSWNGRARYRDTQFCRACVDRCHEATDFAHECAVCAQSAPTPEGER